MARTKFPEMLRKHALAIVTIASIALLITAANLQSLSLWLTLPAWLALAIRISITFQSAPDDSPYKRACYLMTLPILFYFGLWETAFRNLIRLIVEPSGRNLFNFISTRSFLVLVILYFASVCLFYSMKLEAQGDSLERCKQQCKENYEGMKEWQRLAEEADERNA